MTYNLKKSNPLLSLGLPRSSSPPVLAPPSVPTRSAEPNPTIAGAGAFSRGLMASASAEVAGLEPGTPVCPYALLERAYEKSALGVDAGLSCHSPATF